MADLSRRSGGKLRLRLTHAEGRGIFHVPYEVGVHGHDGTVTVQSTAETGTVFTIRLQRAPH